jgi:hypothetical protein
MKLTSPFLVLLLAACAAPVGDRPPAPVPAAASTYKSGVGVIESASVVSLSSSQSATAGGSAPPGPTMAYRLKMEDGTTQNIVQAGVRFELGDRVEVTSNGRLVRR